MRRRSFAATRYRDVADGMARPVAGQPLGQRNRQADDRYGSLGRDREMVVADRRLRRLRGLCAVEAQDADRRRLAARGAADHGGTRQKGEGHAVLTVKTDKGEFILDNQNENVVAWTETGYRFVKRQSQSDPNVWVSLGDNRPAPATA